MFAQTLVITGFLIGAPPPEGPRLEKGLEVRWTGTFSEASFRPGVRASRTYDVDTRLFVLDAGEDGAEAILFTRVFQKPDRKSSEPPTGVVRLDMVHINPRGLVQLLPSPADPDNPEPKRRPWPLVQLQGLPTQEAGMFFEFPDKPLKTGSTWAREESGRPSVAWKSPDVDGFRGYPALKVIAEQKTSGYYSDRIRQPEWRRQDTLTVVPGKGYAARFERIIEKRDPDAEELSFRSVLTLEQVGRIVYPGRLYQERREEAVHAAAFTAMLDRLLASGGREGAKPFEQLARRVTSYLSDHGGNDTVPYREAIVAVRKRAESAAKGNLPPVAPAEVKTTKAEPLSIGNAIADVPLAAITSSGTTKLSSYKGKCVLVTYFQPTASSAAGILKLADELHARKLGVVLPLSIGDPADASKLHVQDKLNVPIHDGTDIYKTHGLDATPVFIVVDGDGIIRHVARGWGAETAAAVTREFEKWAR
jgi:peroxiredoxin